MCAPNSPSSRLSRPRWLASARWKAGPGWLHWQTSNHQPWCSGVIVTVLIFGRNPNNYGAGIKGAQLAVIPGCSHAVHLEKPHLFNATLEDFLVA